MRLDERAHKSVEELDGGYIYKTYSDAVVGLAGILTGDASFSGCDGSWGP